MPSQPEVTSGPWRLTALTAAAAALLTVAVGGLPFLRFAYRAPELHVALETTAALTALVLAFLVYGRFRANGSLQALLLSLSLGIVAVANLLLAMLPSALGIEGQEVRDWASVALRLTGTLLLTAAALLRPDVVVSRRRAGATALLVLGLLAVVAAPLLLGTDPPPPIDPDVDLSESGRPLIIGHPLLLAAHAAGGVGYAVAAAAFTHQATRRPDPLIRWLGAACALAAFSRVNYLLFPSLYSDFVYTGDLLRFGFYVLLLVGAAREVQSFWQARAHAAVLEERRRMARDLHDGLTQELSYIWTQSRALEGGSGGPETVQRINSAAARALDEARSAIAALTRTSSAGFYDVLLATTDGLASRYDAKVVLEVDESAAVAPAEGDAILRIVAEAFRNAVLHGGAACVRVEVTGAPLCLTVRDDGTGFDPDRAPTGSGFGLTSMRERAEGLGADFALTSTPGSGTAVTVCWPESDTNGARHPRE